MLRIIRQPLAKLNQNRAGVPSLLQLRVLCLGFFQDGDVRVGVFPEGEEVCVCTLLALPVSPDKA